MPEAEKKTGREVLHLPGGSAPAVAWKNGRGVTRELALWPPGARLETLDFDWRVSVATVAEPGPFSSFPGYERILVVLAGGELELDHGAHAPRAHVRRLEPYRFSGDWPTGARLPRGSVSDLNVVFRPGNVDASVEAVRLGPRRLRESLSAGAALVHALGGRVTARVSGEEDALELAEGDSLLGRGLGAGEELELVGTSPACVVLLVRLVPRPM